MTIAVRLDYGPNVGAPGGADDRHGRTTRLGVSEGQQHVRPPQNYTEPEFQGQPDIRVNEHNLQFDSPHSPILKQALRTSLLFSALEPIHPTSVYQQCQLEALVQRRRDLLTQHLSRLPLH